MASIAPEVPDRYSSPPKTGKVSPAELATIAAILLLAAILRLGWPGMTEFKADEGRLLTAALEMAGGEFAVHGISSSVGFPNAPMSVWLYSLPLVVWPHPLAATLFTGLLSLMSVAGVYWLARRYGGRRAALLAAMMLAVSPWAIVFSRKIWAQNLLPAFAVLWAISAVLAFVEGRRWFIVFHLVSLAVAVQIHPAAISLLPATLVFLLVFRRAVDWRLLAVGGLLAVLTAAPFLSYLYGRWAVEGGLPFSTGQAGGQISLDSFGFALTVATGQGLYPLVGEDYTGLPGEGVVRLLWAAAILLGVAWTAVRVARHWERPHSRAGFIVLAWYLAPALFFLWHRTPVYIHYFIASLPAAYLMAGAFLAQAVEKLRPGFRPLAWAAILLVVAWQLAGWANLMFAIARDPAAGGFGLPLGVKLAAADAARAAVDDGRAAEVILVGDGSDPNQDDFPAEFQALLHGVPVRYADINAEAIFPAAPAAVLMDTISADRATSLREIYLDAAGTILDGEYTVLALPASAAPLPEVPLPQPDLLANFVRLSGHNDARIGSDGMIWDVFWLTADQPDPADYHLFNHLINGAGVRIAQADAAMFSGAQWRAGDTVISRFLLTPPDFSPPLTMRVGIYRFPSLESVPVLDEAANPAADAVEWPLGEINR